MRIRRGQFMLLGLMLVAASLSPGAEKIGFNEDIKPILSENCFKCHGPDKNTRLADLRLDLREQAIERGAIAPGDVEKSKIVSRIYESDPMRVMPPSWSDKSLTDKQRELLKTWIEQGAEYEPHWSYIPPKRPEAPDGPAAIDYLINRKLEEKGLEPVGEADARVLIRRLSFDLTGLPPSSEQVRAFVNDTGPRAYKKIVEKFLASPHYGERMAVHWLDLVRYADSVGYHSDVPIDVYPYRDYVIRAFNENKPFDEFTREQLAGDLLPNPSDEQLVASAYNRLNRMSNEGGAQAKEYLVKYAVDRVGTTASVWLGSTLGCAQCHDHKFDPFTSKDFYQMGAFFADIEEEGVYSGQADFGPQIRILSDQAKAEVSRIDSELERLRAADGELQAETQPLKEFRSYWREETERWRVLKPERAWADCEHPDIEDCDDHELRLEADGSAREVVTGEEKPREAIHRAVISPNGDGPITAVMLEAFCSDGFEEFFLSEFEVEVLGRGERPLPIEFGALVPDREEPGSMLRDTLDENNHTGWRGDPAYEGPRRAVWVFKKPFEAKPGEQLRVTMVYNGRRGRQIAGRFRLSATDSAFPEIPPDGRLHEAIVADGELSSSQQEALEKAFREITRSNPRWREIRRLERRKKTLVDYADECLITKAVDEPRVVRILPRGNWMDDSGEIVEPQAPHFLDPLPESERRLTRLDLANWLVDRGNPLTARVFVNHLWKMFFGTGLSKVLDDLGSQGEAPIHQELLDWLAVEFMESGWDVKHIVRTMVLSDTYRRSSEPTPELLAKDAYNRLHGRQSMMQLAAEFIRDNALAVSGLLNREMGGPSIKPYQPEGYYNELNFPKRVYEADWNDDQFRRGVYIHWQRTFLHPSLLAFDAPSREDCTAQRSVSNTPLQSLTLLNDPTYVEAARAFAVRILRAEVSDTAGRLAFAFEEAFSRPPKAEERQILRQLLERQRGHFAADPAAADKLLAVGLSEPPAGLDRVELAAWTGVARALFNKHEFVMRY